MGIEFVLFAGLPLVFLFAVMICLWVNKRPDPGEIRDYLSLIVVTVLLVLLGLVTQYYTIPAQPEVVEELNIWLPGKIKPEDWI
jgi:uncharacterized membrane protein